MRNRLLISVAVSFVWAASCHEPNEVVDVQRPRVSLTVSNLPRLGPGEGNYELWGKFVIFDRPDQIHAPQHDSTAISLGAFNVNEDGTGVVGVDGGPALFTVPLDQNPQLLDIVMISVQQADSSELGSVFLAGRVVGDATVGEAALDVSHAAALGSTFSNVSGEYTIIAPTSPADSNSGIWFVERQGSPVGIGLRNLPPLPDEWTYEGWVVQSISREGSPPIVNYFSTGKFLRADSADFDGAGQGSGPGAGFNFPGQDFINAIPPGFPARPDLRLWAVMITVEPVPDNSPLPSSLRLLSTPQPVVPLPQGQTLLMNNVSSTLPQARFRIVRSGY